MPNVQFIGEKVCYGKTENYDWSLYYYLFKRQCWENFEQEIWKIKLGDPKRIYRNFRFF